MSHSSRTHLELARLLGLNTRPFPFSILTRPRLTLAMRWIFPALAAAACVKATALTAILAGGERSCYYADVDGVGEKIGTSSLLF